MESNRCWGGGSNSFAYLLHSLKKLKLLKYLELCWKWDTHCWEMAFQSIYSFYTCISKPTSTGLLEYRPLIMSVLGPSSRHVANYTPSQLLKVAVTSIYNFIFFPGEGLFLEHGFWETSWGMSSTFFFPPPAPSHPSRLSRSTGLSSLLIRRIPTGCPVVHMVMWMLQCSSLNLSHPLLPPLCLWVCSLCLCLHCCLTNRFISTIFLDSIHMH